MKPQTCFTVSVLIVGVVAPRREDENTSQVSISQMPSFLPGQITCDKRKELNQKEMEKKRETVTKIWADIE